MGYTALAVMGGARACIGARKLIFGVEDGGTAKNINTVILGSNEVKVWRSRNFNWPYLEQFFILNQIFSVLNGFHACEWEN